MKFIVEKIIVDNNKINYQYRYDAKLAKYFRKNNKFFVQYDQDISNVPESILIIPFLANIMPIAWFVGFDVYTDNVDSVFVNSLKEIKTQFSKYYPEISNINSNLIVKQIAEKVHNSTFDKKAMLFSGGVDAYTTYLRHFDETPDLITIKGADIKSDDDKQWEMIISYNLNQPLLKKNNKYFIECNLRDFYSFEVDKLLKNLGWWGKIQHGLALTAICAPLSFLKNHATIYIASSYTRKENYDFIIWGSMPEIDNKVAWSNTQIKHDAESLTRQEKVEFIVEKSLELVEYPQLRVCYNEFKDSLNCSKCEKCLRTIFALMIVGANPNRYGFETNISVFNRLNSFMDSLFTSTGNRLFWKEIFECAKEKGDFFNSNSDIWNKEYQLFLNKLELNLNKSIANISKYQKLKLSIINKYPKMFDYYLKLRRKL